MKIVAKGASVYILDSSNRIVITSPPVSQLADIYVASWVRITDDVMLNFDEVLVDNITSFKALKHYATGYICTHDMPTWRVPVRYIEAYKRNKHLYKK